jgi:hypothetical protein
MPDPTAKKKKAEKNLTDVNLPARSMVEPAIGEPLIQKKPRKSSVERRAV